MDATKQENKDAAEDKIVEEKLRIAKLSDEEKKKMLEKAKKQTESKHKALRVQVVDAIDVPKDGSTYPTTYVRVQLVKLSETPLPHHGQQSHSVKDSITPRFGL